MEIERLREGREVTLTEVLDARERRVVRQNEMLKNGDTLVSFTLNMPGPVKQFPLAQAFFERGLARLERALDRQHIQVNSKTVFFDVTGSEAFLSTGAPPLEIKKITSALEESSQASRLYDMDVLNSCGQKIERGEVGLPSRTCIVCGRPVLDCAPRRIHSADELARTAVKLMYDDECETFSSRVAEQAQRALLCEVCVSLKPGLVDRFNNGSHRDMDLFTFIDSACALAAYFRQCVRLGIDCAERRPDELFRMLRLPGMEAEEAMYAATGGVNAHKGAIFSVGVLCAARGWLWARGERASLERLAHTAAAMTTYVNDDFSVAHDTAGVRIFKSCGVSGVRGEASAGFPSVLKTALPLLEKLLENGASLNDAAAVTLLRLICEVDDTNMIRRSSLERFRAVQRELKAQFSSNSVPSRAEIEALDQKFISENLSPGGCADLLALTLLLHFMKEFENETASWSAGPA
ncbi:MAG: triphosphoribosyl-dephospho-CoA synthase CitG [Pyramidobacter sp.]|nr:triphosphoribosyl-dephospho-CoA synthase CitG [Pyramidobacter sp.]